MLKDAISQMFDELDEFLASRPVNRLQLVHGYTRGSVVVSGVGGRDERATVSMQLPVVWEPKRNCVPLRASDTPVTDEPDRLEQMIRGYVQAGGLARFGHVAITEWCLERDERAVPSRRCRTDVCWTARVTFAAV